MRIFVALPLLALAACQVTKDDANDSVTVEYNQDVAENGIEDAANMAERDVGLPDPTATVAVISANGAD